MKNYENGQIKVVWVSEDPNKIHSKMFNNLKKAKEFTLTKEDFLIFRLIHQESMEEFSWELLPYGKHKLYLTLLSTYTKPKARFVKFLSDILP